MKTLLVGRQFEKGVKDSLISNPVVTNIIDSTVGYDLIIWNSPEEPIKDKGAVLVYVSNSSDIGVSLTDLYRNGANAVILINKEGYYDLVDALGNLWCRTTDQVELLNNVVRLYEWSKSTIRIESTQSEGRVPYTNIQELDNFCNIIRSVSENVDNERGGRYFGNASTRCSKMFPTLRSTSNKSQYILVTKRNTSKRSIKPNDFVVTKMSKDNKVLYYGKDKPSVDTPIQIELYQSFPNINFMIHGHAYISREFLDYNLINYTNKYCSCGDLREAHEVRKYIQNKYCDLFVINLQNHGFIIATDTLGRMKSIVNGNISFIYRDVGEERVKI